MPIKIDNNLPSAQALIKEGIFIMRESRAVTQDIRPLKIAVFNIMPTKVETETQIMRLLGNSPLQIDLTLLRPVTHVSKNTPSEYLETFYKSFDDIKSQKFDGLIITGAPVEKLEFEEVTYWRELQDIMDWSKKNVFSTLHICWGAQAGLYHHFGIPKYPLEEKLSGVFMHNIETKAPLMNGFDDCFYAPHSRYTEVRREDILKVPELTIFSESEEAGVFIVAARKGRQIFVTGHLEYDRDTLKNEYIRDLKKGISPQIPKHYFKNDDPSQEPIQRWRSHANLMFVNWLNYYVYQTTPFDLSEISENN